MIWPAPIIVGLLVSIDQILKLASPAHHNKAHAPLLLILFILISCLMLYREQHSYYIKTGFLLLLSGGISNLIDILSYNSIRDIYRIASINLNLADLYIVIGCIIVLITLIPARIFSLDHKHQSQHHREG